MTRSKMRRIALFFAAAPCRAGTPLDVDQLASQYTGSVEAVKVYEDFHDPDVMADMSDVVRSKQIDAVILAGRSPDHYEATLGANSVAEELERAGINPNLIVYANLSEHCSKVHAGASPEILNRKAKEYLYGECERLGLSYTPSQANFVWVDLGRDCREVFTELLRRGVIVRRGDAFGAPTHIRVTTGTTEQNERFVGALGEVLGAGG